MKENEWLIVQLVSQNLISPEQLKKVQQIKKTTGRSYESIILELGFIKNEQLLDIKNTKRNSNDPNKKNKFDRYTIEKKLGEGQFGTVFLAFDNEWDRQVAIKILKSGRDDDETSEKRFKREAQAISQLDHPGVVKVYERGKYQNQSFYTMTYIEGKSLADILKEEKRMPSRKAARLIRGVAEVIQHAHGCNVLHRDIKPENIMIDEQNRVYLTDFGLAKSTRGSKLSQTGLIIGTPAYMSPEQARGKKIDKRSDVYGLGATLYELLTGQVPFAGNNPTKILIDIMRKTPIAPHLINPTIPREIERICLKSLEKDRDKRYSSVEKMIEEINLFLEGKSSKQPFSWRQLSWIGLVAVIAFVVLVWQNLHLRYKLAQQNNPKWQEEWQQKQQILKQTQQKELFELQVELDKKLEHIMLPLKIMRKERKQEENIVVNKLWKDYRSSNPKSLNMTILKLIAQERWKKKQLPLNRYYLELQKNPLERISIFAAHYFNNSYYAFYIEKGINGKKAGKVTWKEAKKKCEEIGGHLITLETIKEHDNVTKFIKALPQWESFWIGLYEDNMKEVEKDGQKTKIGKWFWLTDTTKPTTYTKWNIKNKEPNNTKNKEDYAEMLNGTLLWNDLLLHDKRVYICEWDLKLQKKFD
ncbi:protein kinase [Candidatus Uabimicrobium sp. HlEnr_7]|uniref:protein kinase domain-containing protein n=1 Tax=Candidatus Uabimicrobium helgolandensis TaxID=3095367 RepID=UPI0035574F5A